MARLFAGVRAGATKAPAGPVGTAHTDDDGVHRTADTAGAPPAEETYSLTMSDGPHENVSKAEALRLLARSEAGLASAVEWSRGEWAQVNESRQTLLGLLGATITDLAGRNFPTYADTWAEADRELIEARRELRAGNVATAGEHLRQANVAFERGKATWTAYQAQLGHAETRAYEGIAVTAVLAVVIIAGSSIAVQSIAMATATGATVGTGAAIASPLATTGTAIGTGAAVASPLAATGAAVASPLATTGAAVGLTAAGTTTAVGIGEATADAIVTAAVEDAGAALAEGGAEAAEATMKAWSWELFQAVGGRIISTLNTPLLRLAMPASQWAMLQQLSPIVGRLWNSHVFSGQ